MVFCIAVSTAVCRRRCSAVCMTTRRCAIFPGIICELQGTQKVPFDFFVPCVITSMRSVFRGVRASVVKNALESGSAGENRVPRDNGTTDYSLESWPIFEIANFRLQTPRAVISAAFCAAPLRPCVLQLLSFASFLLFQHVLFFLIVSSICRFHSPSARCAWLDSVGPFCATQICSLFLNVQCHVDRIPDTL